MSIFSFQPLDSETTGDSQEVMVTMRAEVVFSNPVGQILTSEKA